MNKKASIGTGISWFAATIIVIVILFIFMFFLGFIVLKNKLSFSGPEITVNEGEQLKDSTLTGNLVLLFDSPVDFNGQKMMIKDLSINVDDKFYSSTPSLENIEKEGATYKLFYESAVGFFDRVYDDCYLVCVYHNLDGKRIENPQAIIGKKCKDTISADDTNIFHRGVGYYVDLCGTLSSSYFKPETRYSELWLLDNGNVRKTVKVKMFVGGLNAGI
ncbi:MAG: hypothetical protein WC781_02905 [Candidatus Pacearchaeota archaeon]|jgi:hypothetical protein